MTEEERSVKEHIKSELASYVCLARERRQLEAELDALEKYKGTLKAQNLDGMPRGTGGSDPTSAEAMSNMSLEEHYRERLQTICEKQTGLELMIQSLEPTERTLARYRYIMGQTWEEVCVSMSYSWSQTHRIHSRMLDKLVTEEMKKEKKDDRSEADIG